MYKIKKKMEELTKKDSDETTGLADGQKKAPGRHIPQKDKIEEEG